MRGLVNNKITSEARLWLWLAHWGHLASAIVVLISFGYLYPAWGLAITERTIMRQAYKRKNERLKQKRGIQ